MNPRPIKKLDLEVLESMPTHRLLSYLRKLQRCEDSLEESDFSPEEVSGTNQIVFKSSEDWKTQYEKVKSVLDARPNING